MARKNKNKVPIPIILIIYAVLLFSIYTSLSTLVLGLWGDTVMGSIDSYDSRLDNTDGGVNRSRTVSKGYYFSANGKEYNGYVIYSSDESWARLKEGETRSEKISYLSFFPYINKPATLTDFSKMGEGTIIYHIITPIGSLFLLLLVTSTLRKKKISNISKKKVKETQINYKRSDINMFCHNCGEKLPEGALFCASCGTKVLNDKPSTCTFCGESIPDNAEFCINCGQAISNDGNLGTNQSVDYQEPKRSTEASTGLVGFSDRYRSPEILTAAKESKKTSMGCMWIMVLVPLLGFPLAGLLMDDFPLVEALVIGVAIALIMLVINLFALSETKKPIWEGTVVNKYSKERSEHKRTEGESDTYSTYTEFTTVITRDSGKKKTIVEKNSGRHMYDYLSVGDRVRYHPKFGTYEKYDKSKDRIIYCNVCSMMNPIGNDRCKRCNNPLFK